MPKRNIFSFLSALVVLMLLAGVIGCELTDQSQGGELDQPTDDDDADDNDNDDDNDVDDDDDVYPDDDDISDDDITDDDDDTTEPPYEPPDGLEVVFYDIGQGDAALVRFPLGSTMLIDGGPNQAGDHVILPHFDSLHLNFLDYMVVTHPDADHCGGLDDVVYEVDVGELWENGETKDTYTWQEFDDAVEQFGIPRYVMERGDTDVIDGCAIEILNADEGWTNPNANSIVMTIDCEDTTWLFTGDITEDAQEDLIDVYGDGDALAADVVKVPHHGSPDHDPAFAGFVSPLYAVISVGADNPYGHPREEVIAEWEAAGANVYRTDEDGTVTINANQGSLTVTTED